MGVGSKPAARLSALVIGLVLLVAGHAVYGRVVAATVRPDPDRVRPAIGLADGVDFVPMATWRVYLVQLLNIAGLGPVFGPIMGALWGPQVFLWVVLGCILGGAVHDFLIGTIFLARRRSRWWLGFFPAVFMTVVTTTYILVEDVGCGLSPPLGTCLGLLVGVATAVWFLVRLPRLPAEPDPPVITTPPSEAERSGGGGRMLSGAVPRGRVWLRSSLCPSVSGRAMGSAGPGRALEGRALTLLRSPSYKGLTAD